MNHATALDNTVLDNTALDNSALDNTALDNTAADEALRFVSVVPVRVDDPARARAILRSEGAVILTGVEPSPEGGMAAARAILGETVVDVRPQILASKALNEERLRRRDELAPNDLRRTRLRPDHTVPLAPHNDGFAFGDEAPDYLFLNCIEPCPTGGESWLLDGLALVDEVNTLDGTADVWATSLDHTDPGYTVVVGPIARRLVGGRVQIRMNPYQKGLDGDDDSAIVAATWSAAKDQAAAAAERFRLERGDLLCVDNYRFAHSRDPYVSDRRLLVSTWAWTNDAVAVPEQPLDLI